MGQDRIILLASTEIITACDEVYKYEWVGRWVKNSELKVDLNIPRNLGSFSLLHKKSRIFTHYGQLLIPKRKPEVFSFGRK